MSIIFRLISKMRGKIQNKKEAEEAIDDFFENIKEKDREEIRKIKRLAMKYNIRLGEKRKKFCKYCYSPNLEFKSIKGGRKTVRCRNCNKVMRWRIQ